MDFKQLEYFVTVANAGSFTKAADLLYINQSSISRAIASLEEEWEATLFLRSKKGAFLTVEGQEYYNKASQLLQDLKEIAGTKKMFRHRYLTFASYPSNYISFTFSQFCMKHCDDTTVFRLLSRSTSEILHLLTEQLVDCGFIYSSRLQYGKLSRLLVKENLCYEPLFTVAPCIYIGALADEKHKGEWTINDLKNQHYFKANYDFKENYHDLSNTISVYGLEEVLSKAVVVDEGYGITQLLNRSDFCYLGHIWLDEKGEHILPNPTDRTIYDRFIKLDSYDGEITLGYVYRNSEDLSPYIMEFIQLLKEQFMP